MKENAKFVLYHGKLKDIDKNLTKLIKEKRTAAKNSNNPYFER